MSRRDKKSKLDPAEHLKRIRQNGEVVYQRFSEELNKENPNLEFLKTYICLLNQNDVEIIRGELLSKSGAYDFSKYADGPKDLL